jgi:hypothetical protein
MFPALHSTGRIATGRCLLILLLLLLTGWHPASAEEERREKIKAVFLYKFFDYVNWPESHDPRRHPPAVICVKGHTAMLEALKYLSARQQDVLPSRVSAVSAALPDGGCHILFANAVTGGTPPPAHTLTISDTPGFAAGGGMIELRDRPGRMELIINLPAAEKAGLDIRSTLLGIAEVIR